MSCGECGTRIAISKTTIHKKRQGLPVPAPGRLPPTPQVQSNSLRPGVTAHHYSNLSVSSPGGQQSAELNFHPRGKPVRDRPHRNSFRLKSPKKEAALAQLPSLIETGVLDQETADLRRYNLRGRNCRTAAAHCSSCPRLTCRNSPRRWRFLSSGSTCLSQSDGGGGGVSSFREFIRDIKINRQGNDWGN